jgi:MFS family permease
VVFGVAFAVAGMGAGVTYVSSLYYSLEGHAVSRGARAGIHEAVLGSGVFLGPLFGGFVAEIFGLRAPYIMSALVFVAVAIAVYMGWRQMRRALRRREQQCETIEVSSE